MSIGPVKAEVCCDTCGLETEPVELGAAVAGMWSMQGAIDDLAKDGWVVSPEGDVTCPDCPPFAPEPNREIGDV